MKTFLLAPFMLIWKREGINGGNMEKGPFYLFLCFLCLVTGFPTLCLPGNIPWLHPELVLLTFLNNGTGLNRFSTQAHPREAGRSEKLQGPDLPHENRLRRKKTFRKLSITTFDMRKGRSHKIRSLSLFESCNLSHVWRTLTPQSTKNEIASK